MSELTIRVQEGTEQSFKVIGMVGEKEIGKAEVNAYTEDQVALIDWIEVSEEHRGNGYAKKLTEAALEEIEERGDGEWIETYIVPQVEATVKIAKALGFKGITYKAYCEAFDTGYSEDEDDGSMCYVKSV